MLAVTSYKDKKVGMNLIVITSSYRQLINSVFRAPLSTRDPGIARCGTRSSQPTADVSVIQYYRKTDARVPPSLSRPS